MDRITRGREWGRGTGGRLPSPRALHIPIAGLFIHYIIIIFYFIKYLNFRFLRTKTKQNRQTDSQNRSTIVSRDKETAHETVTIILQCNVRGQNIIFLFRTVIV